MAFLDEYQFTAHAGNGGDGVVRWTREKFRPKGGPCGGDGGTGGDVYIEAVRDINMLFRLSHKESFRAEPGEPGGSSSCHGANGADEYIPIPLGSVVTNIDSGQTYELLKEGERVQLLAGGAGGYGNEHFKSSTNQRPMQCTQGKEGQVARFKVELKLMADVGLVGLPNAGKTSLLNALTNAGARVGDYPFTTLDPNLGVYHGYVIADIPGLIEGASQGKGLGHKFLRHISRTRVLLHCISAERDTSAQDYRTIRDELLAYPGLEDKIELVVLTKSDTIAQSVVSDVCKQFQQETGKEIWATVSVLDDATVKALGDRLTKELVQ